MEPRPESHAITHAVVRRAAGPQLSNVPGNYTVGDVKPGPQFTHVSYDDLRILRDRRVLGLDAKRGDRLVPNTAITDPHLAAVGLNAVTRSRDRADGAVVDCSVAVRARGAYRDRHAGPAATRVAAQAPADSHRSRSPSCVP
ncbi:MAG: hypothetical protein N3D71_11480 [Burkholderiaceae bacterium]|nr:hypothetical protein [Burkholderiaceae bacterium]